RHLDGAHTVRVTSGVEQDLDGHSFPLALVITYPDAAAMARGFASPARYESRDLLPNFFAKYIDRKLLHYEVETDNFMPNQH
ncbi:MAG: hypothetical protein ACPHDN_02495, partial [Candidatus Puniceispirillaceae bacterium]